MMRRAATMFLGTLLLTGCMQPGSSSDFLGERLVASQARMQEQMTIAQKAYTESIAEALGTAKAAQQKAGSIEASIESLAMSVKEVKTTVATAQKEMSGVAAQLKTMESTLRQVTTKTEEKLQLRQGGDPDLVTIQLRVPPGPLAKGKKGPDVLALHRALHLAGVRVNVLDNYTKDTEAAIKEFQKAEQLKPTGVYDAETATHLRQALAGDTAPMSSTLSQSPSLAPAMAPSRLPVPLAPDKSNLAKPVTLIQ